jgi:hypothetical protein
MIGQGHRAEALTKLFQIKFKVGIAEKIQPTAEIGAINECLRLDEPIAEAGGVAKNMPNEDRALCLLYIINATDVMILEFEAMR